MFWNRAYKPNNVWNRPYKPNNVWNRAYEPDNVWNRPYKPNNIRRSGVLGDSGDEAGRPAGSHEGGETNWEPPPTAPPGRLVVTLEDVNLWRKSQEFTNEMTMTKSSR